eukprot:scaffold2329_cov17-Tisochrysis_lutea.AAC.2
MAFRRTYRADPAVKSPEQVFLDTNSDFEQDLLAHQQSMSGYQITEAGLEMRMLACALTCSTHTTHAYIRTHTHRYRLLPMDLESSRPLPISGKFTKFHVDLKQTEHQ